MAEQIANLSYVSVKKESTKGTPVTPTTYLPIFSENIKINMNLDPIDPIVGLKTARYSAVKGQRSYTGEITFLGEPNTVGYIMDMLLTKTATSGANPYTHTFNLSASTDPNSYTVDVKKGRSVWRFWGLEIRDMAIEFDQNKMKLKCSVSALGALTARKITVITTTTTLTLDTTFGPDPTKGFVASDLVRIFKADGSVLDTTISSITAANDQIVVASGTGLTVGDVVTLRPATSSYTFTGDYFTFGRTQFRFAADASTAASATHTPVEKDAVIKIMHNMLPEEGTLRSGSNDPVSLIRGTGDIELATKIFFDNPDEQNRMLESTARAVVIKALAGATDQHELRITINNMVQSENPVDINVGDVLMNDIKWLALYNTSDTQMFDVKVLNGVSTI